MTSRRVAILTAVAVLVGAVVTTADAQVTRTEILQRESPLAVDRTPGATSVAGQRERISGKVHGELDPNDPRNAIITDIRLAPRNAKAPLGTYTGWNTFSSGVFKGQMCIVNAPVGGFIPFATTRAERLASGDPRVSLEERYGTHDGYVKAVTAAANALVTKGFLLRADADAMIGQAEASRVLR